MSPTQPRIRFPGEDCLTEGILEMARTKKIHTWLVLAVQVQLDIHYMLLEDISRPHSELCAAATSATASLKRYQSFSKDMHLARWPPSNDDIIQIMIAENEFYIVSDFLDPVRSNHFDGVAWTKGEISSCCRDTQSCAECSCSSLN